jgi:hypothetical protein
MHLVIKTNLPILISNNICPNRKDLEKIKKFVPKRKLINKEVPNFQDTQKKNVQIVSMFIHDCLIFRV